ncbi:MAG: serine/threonine protein kinase, partial [Gemmatimonadetes bacterium]|nr:serine/threonine protein kinase [Gemmatimonadota bacterium]
MSTDRDLRMNLDGIEDEYEIIGELGRGGIAVVYLARDRELGREVAIKVIRDQYLQDPEAMARFEREARTLAQLQHPNIITLYTARRLTSGGLVLVMQLTRGLSLRETLRREGAVSFARAEQVLRDIAGALAYLHRRGVVHRDIKPENIFFDDASNRALLSDFGIAKACDGLGNVTMTGIVVGTPAYMSPEQIDGSQLDGRSDLYSLGLVGWELLAGQQPWEGENL